MYSFLHDNFSARGRAGGAAPLVYIWDPLISRKLLFPETLKFYTRFLYRAKYFFLDDNLSARGVRGRNAP